jgi:hypothetical protein
MDTRPYRLNWPRLSVIYDVSPGKVFTAATQQLRGVVKTYQSQVSSFCLFRRIDDRASLPCLCYSSTKHMYFPFTFHNMPPLVPEPI